jgi:hypothetical protein
MSQIIRKLVLAECIAATIGVLCAQVTTGKTVTMAPSPHPNIGVTPIVPGSPAASVFVGNLAALQPACFLLANNDPRAVVGVRVIWTTTSYGGKQNTHRYSSDNLSNSKLPPVLKPSAQMLVAPATWLPEERLGQVSVATISALQRFADRFASVSAISVQVDSIVFADGATVGSGAQQFAGELAARRQAGVLLAQTVTDAQGAGQSVQNILSQIVAAPTNQASTNDLNVGFWKRTFANDLLHVAPSLLNRRVAELAAMKDVTSLQGQ